jgi:hypothetical protein
VHGIEIDMLHLLDAGVPESPFIDEYLHRICKANLIRTLIENSRLDNQRLLVRQ